MADSVSFSFWRASSWNKFIVSSTEFYVLNSMLISVLPLSSTPGSLLCLLRTHQGLPGKINNDNLVKVTWKSKLWIGEPDLIKRYLEITLDWVENTGDLFHGSCTLSQGWLLLSQRLADLAQSMEASWKQQSADLFNFQFWGQQMVELTAFDLCSRNRKLPRKPNNPADIYTRLSQHLN